MSPVLNKQYSGNEPVDVIDHALDLMRVVRLALDAYQADPSNVSKKEMASIGYVLIYAQDILEPLREHLNQEGAAR